MIAVLYVLRGRCWALSDGLLSFVMLSRISFCSLYNHLYYYYIVLPATHGSDGCAGMDGLTNGHDHCGMLRLLRYERVVEWRFLYTITIIWVGWVVVVVLVEKPICNIVVCKYVLLPFSPLSRISFHYWILLLIIESA